MPFKLKELNGFYMTQETSKAIDARSSSASRNLDVMHILTSQLPNPSLWISLLNREDANLTFMKNYVIILN